MSDEVWLLVDGERRDVAAFVGSLSVDDWESDTLCTGWRVRDVVGHLVWVSRATLPSILPGLLRARFDIDRAIDRFAIEQGRRPIDELQRALSALVGERRLPPSTAPSGVLVDTIVHHQDMRRALGRPREVPKDRLAVALPTSARKAGVHIRGLELQANDMAWSHGTGPVVTGTGEQLLMCMEGRMVVAAEVGGPGKAALAGRV